MIWIGTLYNYEENNKNAMNAIYNYVDKEFNINSEKFNELYENSKSEIKSRLNGTASSHNRIIYFKTFLQNINQNPFKYCNILYNLYWNEFMKKMKLYPNVLKVFKYLKDNNIKIAISTNLTTQIQLKKIKKLHIENYIDYLLTSEEIGVEKPNCKMFTNIIDYFNVDSSEVIFVGDDFYNDVKGANNIGIKAFLINDYKRESIKNFNELLKFFKQIL